MRRLTRRSHRVLASLVALASAVVAVGCASDPVSPDDWLRRHEPPPQAPAPPPPVQPQSLGFAAFMRTTSASSGSFMNGYHLATNRNLLLWKQVGEDWTDEWEFATGTFTLTDTVIVLRLKLISPSSLSLSGVYEVSGILRGDTLRLAYPDSMQQLSPMFSSGDYLLTTNRGFQ